MELSFRARVKCCSAEQHRSSAVKVMLEGKCGQQPQIVSGIQVFISHLGLFTIFREPSFEIG